MAQRPRLSQIRRNNINFRTFEEQYETLERNTEHERRPVATRGDLPSSGNVDGAKCLVIDEGVIYYWNAELQNWAPVLGQSFVKEEFTYKRYKKTFVAEEGQTEFLTDQLFEVGLHEIDVFIQGMLQREGTDYYELDNRTIVFYEGLPKGAIVTIATPMLITYTVGLSEMQKRISELEYNSYQLMLNQYYDGKNVEAIAMVYDGFINTSKIDYSLTTTNVEYDTVSKLLQMIYDDKTSVVDQFDNRSKTSPSSTVLISNSEMTLPISSSFGYSFVDDFSTRDLVDWEKSNVYWDAQKQLVTNDDTGGGG